MNLIPLVSIRVMREGQPVAPAIGKPFDFTADEKADLDRIRAEHNVESYREPINEAPVEPVKTAEVTQMTAAEKKAVKKAADEAAAKKAAEEIL